MALAQLSAGAHSLSFPSPPALPSSCSTKQEHEGLETVDGAAEGVLYGDRYGSSSYSDEGPNAAF